MEVFNKDLSLSQLVNICFFSSRSLWVILSKVSSRKKKKKKLKKRNFKTKKKTKVWDSLFGKNLTSSKKIFSFRQSEKKFNHQCGLGNFSELSKSAISAFTAKSRPPPWTIESPPVGQTLGSSEHAQRLNLNSHNDFAITDFSFLLFFFSKGERFPEDNSVFQWQTNSFCDGKPKMTKKFGFEISKSVQKKFFWSIFPQFQHLIEFSIFVLFNAYTVHVFAFCSYRFGEMLNWSWPTSVLTFSKSRSKN